mmetsp:Transcript_6695/g.23269  ORF Transcript_6695/g.23269 Transcript_6695/m.23269 type:complete len:324 (+) Transcript_6695:1163-2134(+)
MDDGAGGDRGPTIVLRRAAGGDQRLAPRVEPPPPPPLARAAGGAHPARAPPPGLFRLGGAAASLHGTLHRGQHHLRDGRDPAHRGGRLGLDAGQRGDRGAELPQRLLPRGDHHDHGRLWGLLARDPDRQGDYCMLPGVYVRGSAVPDELPHGAAEHEVSVRAGAVQAAREPRARAGGRQHQPQRCHGLPPGVLPRRPRQHRDDGRIPRQQDAHGRDAPAAQNPPVPTPAQVHRGLAHEQARPREGVRQGGGGVLRPVEQVLRGPRRGGRRQHPPRSLDQAQHPGEAREGRPPHARAAHSPREQAPLRGQHELGGLRDRPDRVH